MGHGTMRLKNYLNEMNVKIFFPKSRKTDNQFAGLIAHIFHGQVASFGYDDRQRQNYVKVNKVRGVNNVDDIVDRLYDQDIEATFAIREGKSDFKGPINLPSLDSVKVKEKDMQNVLNQIPKNIEKAAKKMKGKTGTIWGSIAIHMKNGKKDNVLKLIRLHPEEYKRETNVKLDIDTWLQWY